MLDKLEKVYYGAIITITSFIMMNAGNVVSAAGLLDPPATPGIISGTEKLFGDVTTWILVLVPVGVGAFIGYQALQKSLTEDDAVIADKNKKIKNSMIAAIVAESAVALVKLVLSYY